MATEQQLKAALIKAHQAGDTEAAQLFASKIKAMQQPITEEPTVVAGTNTDFIPTDENLSDQSNLRKPSTFGEKILGGLDAAATLATGATTGAVGFGLGTIQDITNQLVGDGVGPDKANQYAEILTATPNTDEGRRYVKSIGEFLGVLPPVLGTPALTTTSAALPISQSAKVTAQQVQSGAKTAKQTFGELLNPVGAAKSALDKGNAKTMRIPKDNGLKRKLLAEQTASDNPNIAAVTKMLDDEGMAVTNKKSKQALKELSKELGDEKAKQVVVVLENTRKGTKKDINDMLNIIQEGHDKPLFGQENRPSDILGRAVAQRGTDIEKINDAAGKQIGRIAREKLSKNTYDISAAKNNFTNSMEDLGVNFIRGDDGNVSLDFSGSRFVGGDKDLLTRLVNFIDGGEMNGFDAHKTKQFARELVDFGDSSANPISSASQKPIKNLASDINALLSNSSKEYASANKRFSDTADIRSNFNKLVKGMDINSELANQSLANKARRLVSNADTRAPIKQLINDAETVLKKYGKTYDNDINALNYAVTTLEDSFKITPAASLRGNVQRAGVNLAEGMSPELAVTRGLMDKVFSTSPADFNKKMKTYKKLMGSE